MGTYIATIELSSIVSNDIIRVINKKYAEKIINIFIITYFYDDVDDDYYFFFYNHFSELTIIIILARERLY